MSGFITARIPFLLAAIVHTAVHGRDLSELISGFALIIWVIFSVIFAFLAGWVTKIKGRSLWAMRDGEEVPILPQKRKNRTTYAEADDQVLLFPGGAYAGFPSSLQASSQNQTVTMSTTSLPPLASLPAHSQQAQLPLHTLKPRVLPKYQSPLRVLQAVLFVFNPPFFKRKECIDLAEAILVDATQRLKGSSMLWIATALFHRYVTKKLSSVDECVRIMRQCAPTFVERWLASELTAETEMLMWQRHLALHPERARSDDEEFNALNNRVQFFGNMEGLQQAEEESEKAKGYLMQLWVGMLRENIDISRSVFLLNEVVAANQRATKLYISLLGDHPTSIRILRSYASHLVVVERHDDEAQMLLQYVSELEEELSEMQQQSLLSDEEKSRLALSDKSSTKSSTGASRLAPLMKNIILSHEKGAQKQTRAVMQKRAAITLQSSIKGKKKNLDLANEQRKILPHFRKIMFTCLFLVVIPGISIFLYSFITFNRAATYTDLIKNVSQLQLQTYHVFVYAKYYYYTLSPPVDIDNLVFIPSHSVISDALHMDSNTLSQRLLYSNMFIPHEHERRMLEREVLDQIVIHLHRTRVEDLTWRKANIIEMVKNVQNWALDLPQTDTAVLTLQMAVDIIVWLKANVPVTMMEHLKELIVICIIHAQKDINLYYIITSVVGITITFFACVLFWFEVFKSVRKLSVERRYVLEEFFSAPKKKVLKLINRQKMDPGFDPDDEKGEEGGSLHDAALASFTEHTATWMSRASSSKLLKDIEMVNDDYNEMFNKRLDILMSTSKTPQNHRSNLPQHAISQPSSSSSSSSSSSASSSNSPSGSPPAIPSPSRTPNRASPHFLPTTPQSTHSHTSNASRSTAPTVQTADTQPFYLIPLNNNSLSTSSAAEGNSNKKSSRSRHESKADESMNYPSGFHTHEYLSPNTASQHEQKTPHHLEAKQDAIKVASSTSSAQSSRIPPLTPKNKTEHMSTDPYGLKESEEHQQQLKEKRDEELREERAAQISKNVMVLSPRLFFEILSGAILIIGSAEAFYIIAIITAKACGDMNSAVLLSAYRFILVGHCASSMVNAADPVLEDLPVNYEYPYGTAPLWHDLSHMSPNKTLQLVLINQTISFFTLIHQRLCEGAKPSKYGAITGDELIDGLSVRKTLVPQSSFSKLMMDQTNCLENPWRADCDNKDRIYGMKPPYAGLEGLITAFLTQSQSFASETNVSKLMLNDTRLQMVHTAIQYDLTGGINKFSVALIREQKSIVNSYRVLLILMFVIHWVILLVSYVVCMIPMRRHVFYISKTTGTIMELDPVNDTTFDTMRWNEKYNIDANLFDSAHLVACNAALDAAVAMEGEDAAETHVAFLRFVNVMLGNFANEEQLMQAYSLPHSFLRQHEAHHIVMAMRLMELGTKKLDSDKALEHLVHFIRAWLSEHVMKIDREAATYLKENAPLSVLEKEVDSLDFYNICFPPSLLVFINSDDAKSEDRKIFHSYCRVSKHFLRKVREISVSKEPT